MKAANGSASSTLFRYLLVIGLAALLPACGGGGGDGGGSGATMTVETDVISGKVVGVGAIAGALVCLDANANGRCDGERSAGPLRRGRRLPAHRREEHDRPPGRRGHRGKRTRFRSGGNPGRRVATGWRRRRTSTAPRSRPSRRSCACRAETSYPLAEDEIRNTLGLPPKFVINISTAAASGSLTQAAARAVIAALKAKGNALDLSAPGALDQRRRGLSRRR